MNMPITIKTYPNFDSNRSIHSFTLRVASHLQKFSRSLCVVEEKENIIEDDADDNESENDST